jgi:hypothetical protein
VEGAAPLARIQQPAVPVRLELRDGLVGLPSLRSFDVRPMGATGLMELVSLDVPDFGFAAAQAEAVREGYTTGLVAAGLAEPDAAVLVLLAAHGDPPIVTANLAGPLVLAPDGSGRQLVLEGAQFPLREPVAVPG